MAAGLLLGPSLLGRLAPGLSQALFGPEHLGALSALSQLGPLLDALRLTPQPAQEAAPRTLAAQTPTAPDGATGS